MISELVGICLIKLKESLINKNIYNYLIFLNKNAWIFLKFLVKYKSGCERNNSPIWNSYHFGGSELMQVAILILLISYFLILRIQSDIMTWVGVKRAFDFEPFFFFF